MKKIDIVLRFNRPGYIAQPYWTEMYHVIEITKKSGLNRQRSETARSAALKQHLESIGMTLDDFRKLEERAQRPFHQDEDGNIVIKTITECLVEAAMTAKSGIRLMVGSSIRTALHVSPFVTNKKAPDGVWERFAVVTVGSGAKASNQRGLRRSPFIAEFDATGSISFEESLVDPDRLHKFLQYAGANVGVGASRKMGYGRFTVSEFKGS